MRRLTRAGGQRRRTSLSSLIARADGLARGGAFQIGCKNRKCRPRSAVLGQLRMQTPRLYGTSTYIVPEPERRVKCDANNAVAPPRMRCTGKRQSLGNGRRWRESLWIWSPHARFRLCGRRLTHNQTGLFTAFSYRCRHVLLISNGTVGYALV